MKLLANALRVHVHTDPENRLEDTQGVSPLIGWIGTVTPELLKTNESEPNVVGRHHYDRMQMQISAD